MSNIFPADLGQNAPVLQQCALTTLNHRSSWLNHVHIEDIKTLKVFVFTQILHHNTEAPQHIKAHGTLEQNLSAKFLWIMSLDWEIIQAS